MSDNLPPALHASLQQALIIHSNGSDTAHDLAHVNRVWSNARLIVGGEGCGNLRILVAAAYLHDLVSLPKDHPGRHKSSSHAAEAAAPVLQKLGYASDEIGRVQHAILAHSYSANIPPETSEARILQDADRLDALGAIGIARTFAVSGALGRPIYDANDPFAQTRALDDSLFSIDHWPMKLLGLPELMNTGTGKSMALRRLALMRSFLIQLASELETNLPPGWVDIGSR